MSRFTTMLLAVLLLLPFTTTTAEAKTPSSAPQVHVVKQGDTLYEIARRHGLTVNDLKRLNGLSSSRLKLGQKLALNRAAAPPMPQASASKSRPAKTAKQAAGKDVHVVKKGESLYTIARSHQLSVDQLKRLNGLSGSQLKIGQRLALSGAAEVAPVASARAKPVASDVHVVKKGDTLQAIARRHSMTIGELKRLNGLRSTKLKIGQRLALSDPEYAPSPLLLPGDASDDEVVEMAYSARSELEQAAFNFLSTPYRFGGNSRKGIDCSAFVQQVFREVDVKLPRSAREQYRVGDKIEPGQLQKGDLLFFRTYAKFPSHVGIYLGDGKMIHASSRSRRVVVTSLDHPYYRQRFIGAKRISLLDEEESLAASTQISLLGEGERDDFAAPVENPSASATGEAQSLVVIGNSGELTVAAEPAAVVTEPAAVAAEPAPRQEASITPLPEPPVD